MPPYAYPLDGQTLRVMVRAGKGCVRAVTAVYGDRYAPLEESETVALELCGSDAVYDYFQAEFALRPPRFRYAFLLDDGAQQVWFTETGFSARPPKGGFFAYPYINAADLYDVPGWLVDGVVYQIFPERFANGNPANDPPGVRPWHDDRPTARAFYGGDLEGIIQRLPHLEELGVTVLYLTPVFASPSNHKYDTTDYYRVDPHFGEEETLKELVRQCHARGIRVMLDGVFNHCGFDFFAFRDVRERGRESPYADWFHICEFPVKTHPVTYETFATGIASMPKLRTEHPAVRDYLLGVARYWTETCDIDGWRLDVANEVDHAFWREFRRTVRAVKPDAAIVGEIWHDALPWLLGDQFDGVTNYPLREACLDFFARGRSDARGFAEAVVANLFAYPRPALHGCWNLLGSHDTERFMTACGGDVRKAALAAVFLFTWVGAPLIYYGDEIGMEGGTDPDCRRPMIWERESGDAETVGGGGEVNSVRAQREEAGDARPRGDARPGGDEAGRGGEGTSDPAGGSEPWRNPSGRWNERLFQLYKRLIRLRRDIPALRRGETRILHADPVANVVVYWRGFQGAPATGAGAEAGRTGHAPAPASTPAATHAVGGTGVVIVLNNSPRERQVPLAYLTGRGRQGAGELTSVTALLDGSRGIRLGSHEELPRGARAVRVPPYGALLLQ